MGRTVRRWMIAAALAVCVVALLGRSQVLAADGAGGSTGWFAAGGGGLWLGAESGGHGMLLGHWRWRSENERWGADVSFNTDTLRVKGRAPSPLAGVDVYAELAGEYPFAGLLPDYYRRGRRLAGRGFQAGYGMGRLGARIRGDPHFLRVEASARRWVFARNRETAPALELPPESWAFEPAIHYTFWDVAPDPSQWEPHQLFQRIRGVAWGVSVGADIRSDTRPWGARGAAFTPSDPRNDPGFPVVTVRQWILGGVEVASDWRLQWGEEFRWGFGEDDLSRDRLGGLSPYAVRIGGLPWAGLVSGRYVSGHLDLRYTGWADHEFGAFVDGAAVSDPRRVGEFSLLGPAAAVGAAADLRFGPWKADVRVATAMPTRWLADRPSVGLWASAGRRW